MEEVVPRIIKEMGRNISEVNFSTNVAGTTFVKDSDVVMSLLQRKVPVAYRRVFLERERDNEYDENAVKVLVSVKGATKKFKIGYIPRDRNGVLSYVLDNQDKYRVFTSNVNIVGGTEDKPNFGIFFDYKIVKID